MALPAFDDCNRANSTTSIGANYTVVQGVFGINTNAIYPNSTSNESGAYWNVDVFNPNQYAQGVIAAMSAGTWIGLCVRGATGNYAGYYTDSVDGFLFEVVSLSWTELGSTDSIAWTPTDVMRVEAEGNVLRVRRNGTVVRTFTGLALTSGRAGVSGYSGFTGSRIDDLEFGNLSAAASAPPPRPLMSRAILAR